MVVQGNIISNIDAESNNFFGYALAPTVNCSHRLGIGPFDICLPGCRVESAPGLPALDERCTRLRTAMLIQSICEMIVRVAQ